MAVMVARNMVKRKCRFPRPSTAVRGGWLLQPLRLLMCGCIRATDLRPYQRDGVLWMYERYYRRQGMILNDDMGLGKTVQVIALLAALYHKTGATRCCAWDSSAPVGSRLAPHTTGTVADHRRLVERRTAMQDFEARRRARALKAQLQAFYHDGDSEPPQASSSSVPCDNTQGVDSGGEPAAERGVLPTLLLVPSSLVMQWQEELATWGYFDVENLQGSTAEKERVLREARLCVCVVPSDACMAVHSQRCVCRVAGASLRLSSGRTSLRRQTHSWPALPAA